MDQTLRDASFIASDARSNFKNVIAKRSDLVEFDGGRLVAPGADTTYEAGTVLGQVTATKLLKPYNAANVDGSQNPVGILTESTLASADGSGTEVVYTTGGGSLFQAMLIGLDAGAITALNGKSRYEHGTQLFSF